MTKNATAWLDVELVVGTPVRHRYATKRSHAFVVTKVEAGGHVTVDYRFDRPSNNRPFPKTLHRAGFERDYVPEDRERFLNKENTKC